MPSRANYGVVERFGALINLTLDELEVLNTLDQVAESVPTARELVSEGMRDEDCFVLKHGWAACFKLLPDGRRQIVNFSIPGDFLGLRGFLLTVADHSVVTITDAVVSRFPRRRILEIITTNPRLGAALLWALSREEAMVVEHLVNVGRRTALERMAHLLMELAERLGHLDGAGDGHFHLPATQEDLADALGLSAVHVNRVLRQLRERGLVTITGRQLEIHDRVVLSDLAQFSKGYLNHREEVFTWLS